MVKTVLQDAGEGQVRVSSMLAPGDLQGGVVHQEGLAPQGREELQGGGESESILVDSCCRPFSSYVVFLEARECPEGLCVVLNFCFSEMNKEAEGG